MSGADKYVAAAYFVVLLAVLAYVVIFAAKIARLEREVAQLAELARARGEHAAREREEVEVG